MFDPPADLRLVSPCSIQLAGVSQSGKSTICKKIVLNKDRLFTTPPVLTIWVYEQPQGLHDELSDRDDVIFVKNLDEAKEHIDGERMVMLIVDDKISSILKSNADIIKYMTATVHHQNVIFVLILHSIFVKNLRLANLQANYLILMALHRDLSSIFRLSYQMLPFNSKFVYSAYMHSIANKQYPHFVIALHPKDDSRTRYRSNLFFWEECILFLPKDDVRPSVSTL